MTADVGVPHDRGVLRLRPATHDDVDAVVALVEQAYRGDASRAGWTTEADLVAGQRTDAAMVRELLAAPGTVLLLGHDGAGRLVACCQVEDRGDVAYVGMVAVRPGRQGGGIGTALLAAVDDLVRGWGRAALQLTVIAQRAELVAWYERRGFALTDERLGFPYGDERFGRPLRDDLEFRVMRKELGPRTG